MTIVFAEPLILWRSRLSREKSRGNQDRADFTVGREAKLQT